MIPFNLKNYRYLINRLYIKLLLMDLNNGNFLKNVQILDILRQTWTSIENFIHKEKARN